MSFRGLLYFIFFFAASLWVWERAITQDGLPLYLDKHPTTWKADAIYYTLGSFHELFNRDERALEQYERVLEKFPKSPYAESALYGVGACHERLKHWNLAIETYERYVEKYPDGRFFKSVNNNIQILKSNH